MCSGRCAGELDRLADAIVAAARAAHPGDPVKAAACALAAADLMDPPRGRKPWRCSCGIYPDNCDGLGRACPDYLFPEDYYRTEKFSE